MPRLPPSLLHYVHSLDPLLPPLLRATRSLPTAVNELRWLREHNAATPSPQHATQTTPGSRPSLAALCHCRARGVPLQYLLGSQPFGRLDILCRPGVLIPRWETEAYTEALAAALRRGIPAAAAAASKLRILDLCTGTGCIALLLHALLAPRFPALEILGIDVSRAALGLARKNLHWNVGRGVLSRRAETQVRFVEGDVLRMAAGAGMEDVLGGGWDVVVSNPPYISPRGYERETEQSVRRFEPRLALVPERKGEGNRDEDVGDAFYGPLLAIARRVEAKVLLMEVAGGGQAQRLVELIGKESKEHWGGWEIWRDGICDDDLRMVSNGAGMGSAGSHVLHGQVQSQVRAVGSGGPRSIICWHGIGTEWLRRIDTS